MYRVSATTLEKFRRFMNEASEFDTEESLIEALKGLFTGNDKTKVGSGFHALIEGNYTWQGDRFLAEGILFTRDQAAVAGRFRKEHPLMIHEVSMHKVYETAFFPIQVSGRIDGLDGVEVHDHKCKFRNPNFTEYIESIQWKIYADAMDVDVFYYNIFEVQGFEALIGSAPYVLDEGVSFMPHEPLKCTRYDSMQQEIITLLNEFLQYIHDRGFLDLLKPATVTSHF